MGNRPACLSSKHFNYSTGDHPQEDSDVLCKPLLKPSIHDNNHDTGKLHLINMQGRMGFPSPASPPHPNLAKEKQLKLNKKVRFADQVLLISSCTHQEMAPFISSANEGGSTEELFHKKKNESSMFINPSAISMDQNSIIGVNQSSNMVRVKVIISKKELSELLRTKEKQGSDALVERILAPLLSPQSPINNKISQTFNVQQYGSLTWRPSLEHIAEDH